ncbi:MAG: hypothetical protein WC506_05760 [Candidatus Micrarchaeia archaeon]
MKTQINYGVLEKGPDGKYYFLSEKGYVRLDLIAAKGRQWVRAPNGKLYSATSLATRKFPDGKQYLFGHPVLLPLILDNAKTYSKKAAGNSSRAQKPPLQEKPYTGPKQGPNGEIFYGRLVQDSGKEYIRIGDVAMLLDTFKGPDGRTYIRLGNDGYVQPAKGLLTMKHSDGFRYMFGPKGLYLEILYDFGLKARAELEEEQRIANMGRENGFSFKSANGNPGGTGNQPNPYSGMKKPPYVSPSRLLDAPHTDHVVLESVIRKRRPTFRSMRKYFAIAAVAIGITAGAVFSSWLFPGSAPSIPQSPKHETQQVMEQNFPKLEVPIASRQFPPASIQTPPKLTTQVPAKADSASVIDLQKPGNSSLAKKGFWGIARHTLKSEASKPTDSEIYKMAIRLAQKNLKDGHKDMNKWRADKDLKTPYKILVPK